MIEPFVILLAQVPGAELSLLSTYGPFAFGTVVVLILLAAFRWLLWDIVKMIFDLVVMLRETVGAAERALDKALSLAGERTKEEKAS